MDQKKLLLAKSYRGAYLQKRLSYQKNLESNKDFLNCLKLTERVALEAALMAATQGLATAFTAGVRGTAVAAERASVVRGVATRTGVVQGLTKVVESGGKLGTAVRTLAKTGTHAAGSTGSKAIAEAASNTLARCLAHSIMHGGRVAAGKLANAAGSSAGAVGDVSLEGFMLGLAFALLGKPGALKPNSVIPKVESLAGVVGVQGGASMVSLFKKGWGATDKLVAASSEEYKAMLCDPNVLTKTLTPIADQLALNAFKWSKANCNSLMRKAETAARKRDYSEQLPWLVRNVADPGNAHEKLKSDYAGYAAADTGYRLWRATYDFILVSDEAAKKLAKKLNRQAKDRAFIRRANERWERRQEAARREQEAYERKIGYRK